jgi:hypothetical protein
MTKARPSFDLPAHLVERAKAAGGEKFADRLGHLIRVVRWECHLPPDDTWTPRVVRSKTRPILSAGKKLLGAVEEASYLLEQFAEEEHELFDGNVPQVVKDVKRSVDGLMKLTERLDKSLPRNRSVTFDRYLGVVMLRSHFAAFDVPWTSTSPVDPDVGPEAASLAVEAVAAAFEISLAASSKAILRIDKPAV